jgi:hypothetical protein
LLLRRLFSILRTVSHTVIRISMLIRKSTPATKTAHLFAAILGVLLWAGAHATPMADADSVAALPAGAALYDFARVSFYREASQSAGPTAAVAVRIRTLALQYGLAAGSAPRFSAPSDASAVELLARLRRAFATYPGGPARQGEREGLLRNSDAFVRANVRMSLGKEWLGFVYADVGAADSALKWQGLAGIRSGHGVDLFGGWRRVPYHFSPGNGLDSLDFYGPVLGATLAW